MKATVSKKSWEKQTIWNLENGWQATEEYNIHYGPYLTRLESPDGKIWLASNGTKENGVGAEFYNKVFNTDKYIDLPDFANSWVEIVNKNANVGLVRPKFERN